jgi:outer membrane protein TolC
VERAGLGTLALILAVGGAAAQTPPSPPPEPPAVAPAPPAEPPVAPPGEAEPEAPPVTSGNEVVGPTPGAPTIGLAAAVRLALEQSFTLLDSTDAVATSRWQESAVRGQFYPQVTPLFQKSDQTTLFGLDLAQKLPWTGGTLTATGRYLTQPQADAPLPRTTDLRLLLSQPLLRGFGPNATFFDLTNAKRARQGQERSLELARQRLAVQVASAFYNVIAQRQLLEVARQSLERTESLRRASDARLKIGMASKLDVFRAELQSAQARDSMVRSKAALETALEQFRGALALPPGDPVEPEGAALPDDLGPADEPLEALVHRALASRLELLEVRDQVEDARRAASLARQNRLPQLDLNLAVTQLGYGGSFADAWAAADRRVEVSVSTSYPFEQSTQRATSAVAQIQVGARERGVRQQELAVEEEVRASLRELERIRKSVELQRQAVDVAVQQRRLAVLRYQRGLGSNFDVVDAEGSLVLARSALVGLLASYAVARLDLKRVVGSLDVDTEFAR